MHAQLSAVHRKVGPREQNGYSQVSLQFLFVLSHKDSAARGFLSFLVNEVPPSVGRRSDGGLAVEETLQTFGELISERLEVTDFDFPSGVFGVVLGWQKWGRGYVPINSLFLSSLWY